MTIPFVNTIISWFLKKRKHQMELFIKYPIDVQNELLEELLHTAKNTEVGKQYDFAFFQKVGAWGVSFRLPTHWHPVACSPSIGCPENKGENAFVR